MCVCVCGRGRVATVVLCCPMVGAIPEFVCTAVWSPVTHTWCRCSCSLLTVFLPLWPFSLHTTNSSPGLASTGFNGTTRCWWKSNAFPNYPKGNSNCGCTECCLIMRKPLTGERGGRQFSLWTPRFGNCLPCRGQLILIIFIVGVCLKLLRRRESLLKCISSIIHYFLQLSYWHIIAFLR